MKIILLVLDEWPWWQCWFQKLLSPSKPSLCLLLLFLLQLGRLSAVSNQMTAWPGLTWTKISSLNTSASSSLPPFFFVPVLLYFMLPSVHRGIQQNTEQRTASCDSLPRQELLRPYCLHKPFIFKLRLLSVREAIHKIGFFERVRTKVSLLIYNDLTVIVICPCSGKGSVANISLLLTQVQLLQAALHLSVNVI